MGTPIIRAIFSGLLLASATPAFSAPFECSYLFGRLSVVANSRDSIHRSVISGNRVISGQDGVVTVFDLITKTEKTYSAPKGTLNGIVPFGDQVAITIREEKKPQVFALLDLKSGKVKIIGKEENIQFVNRLEDRATLLGVRRARPTVFDPTMKSFVFRTGTRNVHVLPVGGGPAKKWLLPAEVTDASLLNRGRAFVRLKGRGSVLLDLNSGKTTRITGLELGPESQFVHVDNGHFYVTSGKKEKQVFAVDLTTGKSRKIELPGLADDNLQFTPKGILYGKKVGEHENALQLVDPATGGARDLGGTVKTYQFQNVSVSADGKTIAWFADDGERALPSRFVVYDTVTGNKKELQMEGRVGVLHSGMSEDGRLVAGAMYVYGPNERAFVRIWDVQKGTWSDFSVSDISSIRGLTFSRDGQALLLQKLLSKSVVLDLQGWKRFSAAAGALKETGPRDIRVLASAGKLKLARDFPEMLEFFRQGKFKNDAGTAQLYLLQVLEESPNTYYGMLRDFPEALALAKQEPLDLAKLSPALKKRWTKLSEEFLEHRLSMFLGNSARSELSHWDSLIPLRPFLAALPDEVKTASIQRITNTLAAKAAGTPPLKGVFQPKLYKFIKQEVRTWFGENPKKLTDLVLVREESSLRPVIVGVEPIDGAAESATKLGIYVKSFDPIPVPPAGEAGTLITEQTLTWKQNGEAFTGKFQVKTGKSLAELVPKAPQPDYAALWKDKKLTGLMVTGENMQSANPDLINEYISYYRAKGFRFGKPEPVKDMRAFIGEEISSGRLDYMIKEAHTDGMENDLFRLYTKGSIQKGVKKLPNGQEEVMYVFHPEPDAKNTALIPNQEFGEWIRARETGDKGPLVYFNTSCWGVDKACHEYQAAASKQLLVFATTESADTFVNAEDSALRQLITGLREKKNYAQMREMMKKDPMYKKGEYNLYLLPDEDGFEKHVRRKLQRSVDVNVSVTDARGQPYHLDTAE